MGKKSNKDLRKANGYNYNGDESLDKLREELIQQNHDRVATYRVVRQFGGRQNEPRPNSNVR